jgi:hypothetical protein
LGRAVSTPHDEGACGRGRRHLRDRRQDRRRDARPRILPRYPQPPPDERPIRILIADDHPLFERASALSRFGRRHRGRWKAATGEEAVEIALALTRTLVMDINMPGLNGIDATRASSTSETSTSS